MYHLLTVIDKYIILLTHGYVFTTYIFIKSQIQFKTSYFLLYLNFDTCTRVNYFSYGMDTSVFVLFQVSGNYTKMANICNMGIWVV